MGGSFENNTQWTQFARFLTNAIQGVRDAAGDRMPKTIIHIDRGGDWGATQWFFDNLLWTNVTNAIDATGSVFRTTVPLGDQEMRLFQLQSN